MKPVVSKKKPKVKQAKVMFINELELVSPEVKRDLEKLLCFKKGNG